MTKQILIAEEFDLDYQNFEMIIQENTDFLPLRARSGIEAFHLIMVNYRINCAILNINLPILDGYEASKKIRTIRPHFPIFVVAEQNRIVDKEQLIAIGVNELITTPIDTKQVIRLLKKYVR